jgi:hypothetical protein
MEGDDGYITGNFVYDSGAAEATMWSQVYLDLIKMHQDQRNFHRVCKKFYYAAIFLLERSNTRKRNLTDNSYLGKSPVATKNIASYTYLFRTLKKPFTSGLKWVCAFKTTACFVQRTLSVQKSSCMNGCMRKLLHLYAATRWHSNCSSSSYEAIIASSSHSSI